MSPIKEQVIRLVAGLADDVTAEDIIEEIFFKIQVDAGLDELDRGKGIPHEEIEGRMARWLPQ